MQRQQKIILPILAIGVCYGCFSFGQYSASITSSANEVHQFIPSLSSNTNRSVPDPKTIEQHVPHQFTTTAKKCPDHVNIPDSAFKSQSKEDTKLMKWFRTMCSGTYIEMGALDGVAFSNSHVFNKGGLMWKGVMIELMKNNYEKLVGNRPNEIATINAGVCDVPKKLHYYGKGAVGGIYEFAAESFRKQWWDGISIGDPRLEEIQCDTLDSLLIQHAPENTFFDFFSLDVEGAELSVLRSIDFNRVGFGVILVEADEHNELKNLAMRVLLESNGYIYLELWNRSYWFVHNQFHEIYRDLTY